VKSSSAAQTRTAKAGIIGGMSPSQDQDKKAAASHRLPGRNEQVVVIPRQHFTLGTPIDADFVGMGQIVFGMGCFWGAERIFWQSSGVHSTAVGYTAGSTPHPTYEEVCSGQTGHNEVVRVIFDPTKTSFESMLHLFWEGHDPTQGMRQGHDLGTQYRSGIYCSESGQLEQARNSKTRYERELQTHGHTSITTEIILATEFFFAEEYHQQYLAKNPGGYCGIGGTGVVCPTGLKT